MLSTIRKRRLESYGLYLIIKSRSKWSKLNSKFRSNPNTPTYIGRAHKRNVWENLFLDRGYWQFLDRGYWQFLDSGYWQFLDCWYWQFLDRGYWQKILSFLVQPVQTPGRKLANMVQHVLLQRHDKTTYNMFLKCHNHTSQHTGDTKKQTTSK